MNRGHQLPAVVLAPSLPTRLQITVSGASDLRRLEAEIESLLARLEDAGQNFELVPRHQKLKLDPHPSVARLLDLGVVMKS
jgi:hypothetical protein